MDRRHSAVLGQALYLVLSTLLSGPVVLAGNWDFNGQEELTKNRIEAFLARAVTHFDTAVFGSFSAPEQERTRQFLLRTGAKFVHGAELSWARAYPDHSYWDGCQAALAQLHTTPGLEDVLLEGFIAEHIGANADNTLIPDWLWSYMEAQGINATRIPSPNDDGGRHYFHYPNFFEAGWRYIDHWGPGQSVPDITQTETKLYFRYLLKEYIDAGFESIWFGQLGLSGAADANNVALSELRQFAREEAAQSGYRHAVLLTSHVDSRPHDGEQMLDYICFPSRLLYSNRYPHGLDINTSRLPIVTNWADLPLLLEIDNYLCTPQPPIGDNGFDEITGFAYKEPWARRAFLEQYYWEVRTYTNSSCNKRTYLSLPGRRNICEPTCSGNQSTNPAVPYPSYWYSPYDEHCGEEETFAGLFSGQIPPAPPRMSVVDLGNRDAANGLALVSVNDGNTMPVTIAGRECRKAVNPSTDKYMYFAIDDGYAYAGSQPELFITIDYFDAGTGSLSLEYDSRTGNAFQDGGSVSLNATNLWKQYRFHVSDAFVGNRQINEADFRIAGPLGGPFYLDVVQVSAGPLIELSTSAIVRVVNRGDAPSTDRFTVTNVGEHCSTLNYVIGGAATWLSAEPVQGQLASGGAAPVDLRYTIDALPLGEYAGQISINDSAAINSPQVVTVRLVIRQAEGDLDFDEDVDQEDFGYFQACLSGQAVPRRDDCLLADLDTDGDVDQADFAIFQKCMTTADVPADPHCAH